MALHYKHQGKLYDTSEVEFVTGYMIDGEYIDSDDVEKIHECDKCGKMHEDQSDLFRLGLSTVVCKKHVPDELMQLVKSQ